MKIFKQMEIMMIKLILAMLLAMLLACGDTTDGGNGGKELNCSDLNIPNGSLAQRGGIPVTEKNLEEAITMLLTELQVAFPWFEEEYNRPPEEILGKEEMNRTENQVGEKEVRSWSYEYFDFSRTRGRLFIGGGKLINETRISNKNESEIWLSEQRCIKIEFNGMFKGELKISSMAEGKFSNMGGSFTWSYFYVILDGIDVTDKLVKF